MSLKHIFKKSHNSLVDNLNNSLMIFFVSYMKNIWHLNTLQKKLEKREIWNIWTHPDPRWIKKYIKCWQNYWNFILKQQIEKITEVFRSQNIFLLFWCLVGYIVHSYKKTKTKIKNNCFFTWKFYFTFLFWKL